MAYLNSTGLIVAELTSFTLLVKVLFESVFIFYFLSIMFNNQEAFSCCNNYRANIADQDHTWE